MESLVLTPSPTYDQATYPNFPHQTTSSALAMYD